MNVENEPSCLITREVCDEDDYDPITDTTLAFTPPLLLLPRFQTKTFQYFVYSVFGFIDIWLRKTVKSRP